MRYPIMTVYEKNKIIVTATIENDTPEFLSKKIVTGIAVYIEQFSKELGDFAAMSILITNDGKTKLLQNAGFGEAFEDKWINKIKALQEYIVDYTEEERLKYA